VALPEYIHPEKFGVKVALDFGLVCDVYASEDAAWTWLRDSTLVYSAVSVRDPPLQIRFHLPRRFAMIRGMHAMCYCSQAEALRAFLRDKLALEGHGDVRGQLYLRGTPSSVGHRSERSHDPISTSSCPARGDFFLTDGGIETTLIFLEGLELPTLPLSRFCAPPKAKPRSRNTSIRMRRSPNASEPD
jgi:hypothetical protein